MRNGMVFGPVGPSPREEVGDLHVQLLDCIALAVAAKMAAYLRN